MNYVPWVGKRGEEDFAIDKRGAYAPWVGKRSEQALRNLALDYTMRVGKRQGYRPWAGKGAPYT